MRPAIGILVVLACACVARGVERDDWPTKAWKHAAAEEHGVDSAALDAACAAAPEKFPRFRSLLLVRHGRIVYERYFRTASADSSHNIKSASKGILSALVGIAIADGLFKSVDQPLAEIMPEGFAAIDDPR